MRRLEFVITRFGSTLMVLLGVTVITFLLARTVPTDPAALFLGPRARPEEIAKVAEQMGLNDPLPVQYVNYMKELVQGDLGNSISTKRPVLDEIFARLPATLELLFAGMTTAIIVGILIGVFSARWKDKPIDWGGRALAILGVSIPAFFLGMLFQIVFFRWLGWFPLGGRTSVDLRFTSPITDVTGFLVFDALITGNWEGFKDALWHLFLPAMVLAAFPAGLIARMVRATMSDVLSLDYIRTARAYGQSENLIAFKLALKNAIGPAIAVIGLSFAYALTGSFFVEIIYTWPGLGQLTVNALLNLDYPLIMGVTLLGAIAYIAVNFIVDIVQAQLDPRVSLDD
ncbi:MAG: ABC transporter permease [Actinomycetia bacterium]|nr:ABC transporter permease [Actinomycetes bacterium]